MTEKKEIEKLQNQLESAFESVYSVIASGRAFIKSKNQYYEESCYYALKIYKEIGLATKIKKLLIDSRLSFLKGYFEFLGLFFQYKASEDFLKIIKDSDGLFEKSDKVESLPKYTDFLKSEKESKAKKEIDFQRRLKSLFKEKTKKEIESILTDFLKNSKK